MRRRRRGAPSPGGVPGRKPGGGSSRIRGRQPRARVATGTRPPAALLPWLLDSRSLTRRLRAACPRGFRVTLLAERWEHPLAEETAALAEPQRRWALVRQVLLVCNDVPWIYARTVIPAPTLKGDQRRLAHLGARPLGSVLWSFPGLAREAVCIDPLHADEPLARAAARTLGRPLPLPAWTRRTRFALGSKRLHVTEVFLPGSGDG